MDGLPDLVQLPEGGEPLFLMLCLGGQVGEIVQGLFLDVETALGGVGPVHLAVFVNTPFQGCLGNPGAVRSLESGTGAVAAGAGLAQLLFRLLADSTDMTEDCSSW